MALPRKERVSPMLKELHARRGAYAVLGQFVAVQRDVLAECGRARPAVALAPLPRSRALRKFAAGVPLLHREWIDPDVPACRELFERLVGIMRQHECSAQTGAALADAAVSERLDFDAALFEALVDHADHLRELLRWCRSAATLARVLELVARAPLQALACRVGGLLEPGQTWRHGYCPVCGAWPGLAEACKPEHGRRLRCLRCGASWSLPTTGCCFCGRVDPRRAGAPRLGEEADRWVEACDACGAYIKVLKRSQAAAAAALALDDLESLSLDLVALERGYRRPRGAGFRIELEEGQVGGFGEDELELD